MLRALRSCRSLSPRRFPRGLSGRTLEKHRTYGTGPAYRKLGGRVVYSIDDLQAWVARGTKTSTSDARGETLPPAKRHAAVAPAYLRPHNTQSGR